MTNEFEDKEIKEKDLKDLNNTCEECKKEDESVSQNLILTGFKICKSCKISKTIFPIQLTVPVCKDSN